MRTISVSTTPTIATGQMPAPQTIPITATSQIVAAVVILDATDFVKMRVLRTD